MRQQVLNLLRLSVERQILVSVLVNNKAEGCEPATLRASAEMLASADLKA